MRLHCKIWVRILVRDSNGMICHTYRQSEARTVAILKEKGPHHLTIRDISPLLNDAPKIRRYVFRAHFSAIPNALHIIRSIMGICPLHFLCFHSACLAIQTMFMKIKKIVKRLTHRKVHVEVRGIDEKSFLGFLMDDQHYRRGYRSLAACLPILLF